MQMSESTASKPSWNDIVITEFRAGNQRIADRFDRSALLLLHTTGARTGEARTSPLAYFTFDGEIVITASAAGRDANPAWFFNLVANPSVSFERWHNDAIESVQAKAVVPEGPERDRFWKQITDKAPGFAEYEKQTTRTIPVVILRPV
jgi:deazaflavin-dependent oxidoreductase (nitroreductase family)